MSSFVIHHGDCIEVLRTMPDNSVDSIVTDPPYGLSFMGKKWDYDVPSVELWAECLRVLKPGGHLLAFAGTRTQHRMAVRIEDAGFEIRDMIAWVYGSGFPKSHNGEWGGTALKPALEPVTVARKPLVGTVEQNWREYGTGALNIDGCRVPTDDGYTDNAVTQGINKARTSYAPAGVRRTFEPSQSGRWPANLIHDGGEEVLTQFPHSKSGSLSPDMDVKPSSGWAGGSQANRVKSTFAANEGSAARFFYCAKASKRDRDEGLEGFAAAKTNDGRKVDADNAYQRGATLRANIHPTVKPTDLMRYLCRLVTPPGGVVLDPFTGSGSTGKAAVLEGFRFIGIEREAEYVEIAQARIEHELEQEPAPQGDLFNRVGFDMGAA